MLNLFIINHMVKYNAASEKDLDQIFSALGDSTRRAIIGRLSSGEALAGELALPHDMSLPAISKHLRVLENAGLIRRRKIGRTVMCELDPTHLETAAEWITYHKQFWDDSLDSLSGYLHDIQNKGEK